MNQIRLFLNKIRLTTVFKRRIVNDSLAEFVGIILFIVNVKAIALFVVSEIFLYSYFHQSDWVILDCLRSK